MGGDVDDGIWWMEMTDCVVEYGRKQGDWLVM